MKFESKFNTGDLIYRMVKEDRDFYISTTIDILEVVLIEMSNNQFIYNLVYLDDTTSVERLTEQDILKGLGENYYFDDRHKLQNYLADIRGGLLKKTIDEVQKKAHKRKLKKTLDGNKDEKPDSLLIENDELKKLIEELREMQERTGTGGGYQPPTTQPDQPGYPGQIIWTDTSTPIWSSGTSAGGYTSYEIATSGGTNGYVYSDTNTGASYTVTNSPTKKNG